MNEHVTKATQGMEMVVSDLSQALERTFDIANPAGRKLMDKIATSYLAETLELARQLHGRLLMVCDE